MCVCVCVLFSLVKGKEERSTEVCGGERCASQYLNRKCSKVAQNCLKKIQLKISMTNLKERPDEATKHNHYHYKLSC